MDLQVFHDAVRFFLNKETGGWETPEEIDANAQLAQMWVFTKYLPFYGKDQKATNYLSPFSTSLDVVTGSDGIVTLPTTEGTDPYYESLLSIGLNYFDGTRNRYKPIKILEEDKIQERIGSQILAPTSTDPVGMETTPGKIQLFPKVSLSTTCYYLRRPKAPVFKYTQSGVVITYDKAGSTQFEWTEIAMNEILMKTLNLFGVNLSDQMVIQYTQLKNQEDI